MQKMKRGYKFKVCCVLDNGYEDRTYSTPRGACLAWAEDVVHDLTFDRWTDPRDEFLVCGEYDWDAHSDAEQSRIKFLRKKAYRRALPIFEKAMGEKARKAFEPRNPVKSKKEKAPPKAIGVVKIK
jgi:hypothetical protein